MPTISGYTRSCSDSEEMWLYIFCWRNGNEMPESGKLCRDD
ncbi:MAG: hypothetical protein ABW157_18620 [Candidatus Thiodiazotropha sp. LLP2]